MRKLAKKIKLSRKEWMTGFMIGRDGIFYVVVDTIFSDRGKLREDNFYYTRQQFQNKFGNIKKK